MKKENYQNLDVARYIGTIIIIIVHLGTFQNISSDLHYFFNTMISRICVPLFFFITAYFIGKKEKNKNNYIWKYVKSLFPLYLLWSILYLPFGIHYLEEINIPIYLYPLGIIFGFIYTGTWYHLWYFPALIGALLILKWWKKHFSLKSLLFLSLIFLIIGSFETYYGILPPFIKPFVMQYMNLFYTTRNFLFFGLWYVVLGYIVGSEERIIKYLNFKLLLSIILFIMEGCFLHNVERLNCNILITCIPLTYYLFYFLKNTKEYKWKPFLYPFRELYKYYYLIHPFVIFIYTMLMKFVFKIDISTKYQIVSLLIVIIFTHLFSNLLIKIRKIIKQKVS